MPFTPATGDRVLVKPGRDRTETIAVFARAVRQIVKDLELSSVKAWKAAHIVIQAWSGAV